MRCRLNDWWGIRYSPSFGLGRDALMISGCEWLGQDEDWDFSLKSVRNIMEHVY